MDLTKLSEVELKVMYYDELVKFEMSRNNLTILNQELAKRSAPPVEAPVVEVKEEVKE